MCLDILMLSIAMARLKTPGCELVLSEFLCIIKLSYIQAP